LPVYGVEILILNEQSLRFLDRACVTVLRQATKRRKLGIFEHEKKKPYNFHVQKYSFWLDMKIPSRTLLAVFRKERV
jgi:hypothetical protein